MVRKLVFILIGVVLGSSATYVLLHFPHHNWVPLTKQGKGLAWSSDALFNVDIPFPETTSPEGKFKFVNRGIGHGTELGFLVKTKMDKLDVSKLPAKYKTTEQRGQFTIGPTDAVVYTGHLDFTLKDGDGFVLMTTKSEPIEIWSGKENTLQGFAKDSVPDAVVKRTVSVEMELTFDKCETCRP